MDFRGRVGEEAGDRLLTPSAGSLAEFRDLGPGDAQQHLSFIRNVNKGTPGGSTIRCKRPDHPGNLRVHNKLLRLKLIKDDKGTHHNISHKHTGLYFAELDHKYNTRKMTDGERTVVGIRRMEGKRLMLHAPKRKAS